MSKSMILNIALFQLGWFACVLGGANDYALIGSIIAAAIISSHCYQSKNRSGETKLILTALFIGFIFESIITASGLAEYKHGQYLSVIAPIWMILMWPLFATTLNVSMRWMKGLHPALIAILGAVSAPWAYYAGYKLGAVSYNDLTLSLSIIAASWAVLLPVVVKISNRSDDNDSQDKSYTRAINV